MKKRIIVGVALLSLIGCQNKAPADMSSTPAATPAPVSTAAAGGEMTGALQADVQLKKEVYFPGDQMEVMAVATNLSDTAWVGIIPSSVPHGEEKTNDENDMGYAYLRDTDNVVLIAPKEPGDYDVRLNDNDDEGKEIASRSFKVEADPNPVQEPKLVWDMAKEIPAGERFEVEFEAPLNFVSNAWIGLVPTETAHGEESVGDAANMGYEHLNSRSRGTVTLSAPSAAGKYDLRMYDDDNGGKEVASITINVVSK